MDYYDSIGWFASLMDRLFFIVNPIAGASRALESFEKVRGILDEMNFEYAYEFSTHRGHATELAKEAVQRGEQCVIAVGGDGTANEVAAGLIGSGVTMGILPFGTGNDLAKVLNIPTEPREALSVILSDSPRKMDAGTVNDKFFLNVSGFGFDVDVLINTEHYKSRFHGMMPYLLGIVKALAQLRTLHLTLHDGERVWSVDSIIVSVGIGRYFGGGMMALPFADPFDGLFDISVVRKVSVVRFLTLLPAFIKGKHTGFKEVEYFRAKELYIECPESSLINYDGELGSGVPVSYKLLPGAVNMLVR